MNRYDILLQSGSTRHNTLVTFVRHSVMAFNAVEALAVAATLPYARLIGVKQITDSYCKGV